MNANFKSFCFLFILPVDILVYFICVLFSFCYLLLFLSSANDNQHSHGKAIADLS